MRVALRRLRESNTGTEGVLILPAGVFCNTLELPWRNNVRQRSSIPIGEYQCTIRQSPKFGRVYEVTGVPGRDDILIHSGNYAGDVEKGFKSHVEGCILLGRDFGVIGGQRGILSSKKAVADFMEEMNGEEFTLVVENEIT